MHLENGRVTNLAHLNFALTQPIAAEIIGSSTPDYQLDPCSACASLSQPLPIRRLPL